MSDALKFIDIPEGRKQLIREITVAKKRLTLHKALRDYISALPQKKMTATLASRAHEFLMKTYPELIVQRVTYDKRKSHSDRWMHAELEIHWHDMESRRYTVYQDADYRYDVMRTFGDFDAQHEREIAHLEHALPRFAYHARKFNDALSNLIEASQFAKPEGSLHPAYPLSNMFAWYTLSHPGHLATVEADHAEVQQPVPDTPSDAGA